MATRTPKVAVPAKVAKAPVSRAAKAPTVPAKGSAAKGRTAPAKGRSTAAKAVPAKGRAAAKKVAPVAVSGPRPETLKLAERVVRLRDRDGLSWSAVAEKVGLPYGANGSSRLRRLYTVGGGATVGVRGRS